MINEFAQDFYRISVAVWRNVYARNSNVETFDRHFQSWTDRNSASCKTIRDVHVHTTLLEVSLFWSVWFLFCSIKQENKRKKKTIQTSLCLWQHWVFLNFSTNSMLLYWIGEEKQNKNKRLQREFVLMILDAELNSTDDLWRKKNLLAAEQMHFPL